MNPFVLLEPPYATNRNDPSTTKRKCYAALRTKMKKVPKFLHSYLRLNIRLPTAQGSNLGDSTNCESSLVLGKLDISHGFPDVNLVSIG